MDNLLLNAEQNEQGFKEYGYVIFRHLIPPDLCRGVVALFEEKIKPYEGAIMRFPSYMSEPNRFDSYGHVLNHITELQGIEYKDLEEFVNESISVFTHENLIREVAKTIEGVPILTQTVYFEGGSKPTPTHQDVYYSPNGTRKLVTAWIALEDINPDASRFCIYPKSHELELPSNSGDYALNTQRGEKKYLIAVKDFIERLGLKPEIPLMQKGDVVLFDGLLIHGSLKAADPQYSRHSITSFFFPESLNNSFATKLINGTRVVINPMQYTDRRASYG